MLRIDLGNQVKLRAINMIFVGVLMLIICRYVWDCQLFWVSVNWADLGLKKPIYCVLQVQTAVCCLGQTVVSYSLYTGIRHIPRSATFHVQVSGIDRGLLFRLNCVL